MKAVWICSLGDGEATLHYPRVLSDDAEDDLLEWLDLVTAILKSRREKRAALVGPAPVCEPQRQEEEKKDVVSRLPEP